MKSFISRAFLPQVCLRVGEAVALLAKPQSAAALLHALDSVPLLYCNTNACKSIRSKREWVGYVALTDSRLQDLRWQFLELPSAAPLGGLDVDQTNTEGWRVSSPAGCCRALLQRRCAGIAAMQPRRPPRERTPPPKRRVSCTGHPGRACLQTMPVLHSFRVSGFNQTRNSRL